MSNNAKIIIESQTFTLQINFNKINKRTNQR